MPGTWCICAVPTADTSESSAGATFSTGSGSNGMMVGRGNLTSRVKGQGVKIPLEDDERVLVRARRHPRVLRRPMWAGFVLMFLLGVALGLLSRVPGLGPGWQDATPYLVILVWVLFALGLLAWVLVPILRWLRGKIVITTRTMRLYAGRKRLEQVPLSAVDQAQARTGFAAGEHGPGTLEVTGPGARVVVRHCPDVQRAADVIREAGRRLPRQEPYGVQVSTTQGSRWA